MRYSTSGRSMPTPASFSFALDGSAHTGSIATPSGVHWSATDWSRSSAATSAEIGASQFHASSTTLRTVGTSATLTTPNVADAASLISALDNMGDNQFKDQYRGALDSFARAFLSPQQGTRCGWLRPVQFNNPELEHRFQHWMLVPVTGMLRGTYGIMALMYTAAMLSLVFVDSDAATALTPGALATLVSSWLLMACSGPCSLLSSDRLQGTRLHSSQTRHLVAACLVTASSILLSVFVSVLQGEREHQEGAGFAGFVAQLALLLFLCMGLIVQVLPVLLLGLASSLTWLLLFVVVFRPPPVAYALVAIIPVLLVMLAKYRHCANVHRRFEFHLVMLSLLQRQVLALSEAELRDSRSAARKVFGERHTQQAFMGYACHELRNPVHGLKGCLQDLMHQCKQGHVLDDGDMWNLESIGAAVEQISQVTADVLDFNKLQAGKLQVAARSTDVRAIIERVAVQYRNSQQAVEFFVDDAVPYSIVSDPLRITQVLTNGVTNALKHSNPGTPVRIICKPQPEEKLLLEVHNNGHGLRGVSTQQLFELYERGDDETSSIKGVGLGLPICKYGRTRVAARCLMPVLVHRMLMKLMGGDIGLEDRGPATVFWFSVPVLSHEAIGAVDELVPGSSTLIMPGSTATAEELTGSSSRLMSPEPTGDQACWKFWGPHTCPNVRRVLVVDDERINRRLLGRMLQTLGYTFVELSDGDEIEATLQREMLFDVLLVDIHMLRSDGRDVVAALREAGHRMPMFACSATSTPEDIASYKQAGFDGILSKPFSVDDVAAALAAATTDHV